MVRAGHKHQMRRLPLLALLPLVIGLASCSRPSSAKEFLAWSMDQHKALKSYSSKCSWSMKGGPMSGTSTMTRTITFEAPNKFVVVAAELGGITRTSISDGIKLTDFSTDKTEPGLSYEAP